MKKVFNDIDHIARLFVRQEQPEAMTPLCHIQNQGKGRRFYFKGDTAYSYRDDFPLARREGNKIYVKDFCPSNTTKKHRTAIMNKATHYNMDIIYSDDLKTPRSNDRYVEKGLKGLINSKKGYLSNGILLSLALRDRNIYKITESKFPLLFDEKHDKLKQMLFSSDYETFDLARKIIKKEKLV